MRDEAVYMNLKNGEIQRNSKHVELNLNHLSTTI
jgi:hypothetical protein